jgi:hypothetical protein
MKKLDQIFYFIRLKNLAKCRHSTATVMDLMLYLRFTLALSHSAQIGSKLPALTIHSVAMLTPLLMKEHRSRLLTPARVSLNNRRGLLWQAAKNRGCKNRKTDGHQDSPKSLGASSQRKEFHSAIVHRE